MLQLIPKSDVILYNLRRPKPFPQEFRLYYTGLQTYLFLVNTENPESYFHTAAAILYLQPTMQILKDASSAAIYGSRASNGVVLITTKAGVKGEAKINFSAQAGITEVAKQMKSLNVAQYKDLMDELGSINLPDGLKDETNWFDETYRTGVTQNYQLSVSSANDKLKYFISGGYTKEDGIIKVAFYERYNLRANLENQIRS